MPWATMSYAGWPASSAPSKVTRPARGAISPEMARSRVVLPAPLGPTTATASPALTREADVPERREGAVAGGDAVQLEHQPSSTGSPRYASMTCGFSATSRGAPSAIFSP